MKESNLNKLLTKINLQLYRPVFGCICTETVTTNYLRAFISYSNFQLKIIYISCNYEAIKKYNRHADNTTLSVH